MNDLVLVQYPLELDFAKVDEVFNAIVRSENG